MILCYDDKNYWRREIFPFYKKNRKQEREASKIDWDKVFSVLNTIRDELRENFPYQVIQVNQAEADDVIASIVTENSSRETPDPMLILSADKDFIQLHKYCFVKQYDMTRNIGGFHMTILSNTFRNISLKVIGQMEFLIFLLVMMLLLQGRLRRR